MKKEDKEKIKVGVIQGTPIILVISVVTQIVTLKVLDGLGTTDNFTWSIIMSIWMFIILEFMLVLCLITPHKTKKS